MMKMKAITLRPGKNSIPWWGGRKLFACCGLEEEKEEEEEEEKEEEEIETAPTRAAPESILAPK